MHLCLWSLWVCHIHMWRGNSVYVHAFDNIYVLVCFTHICTCHAHDCGGFVMQNENHCGRVRVKELREGRSFFPPEDWLKSHLVAFPMDRTLAPNDPQGHLLCLDNGTSPSSCPVFCKSCDVPRSRYVTASQDWRFIVLKEYYHLRRWGFQTLLPPELNHMPMTCRCLKPSSSLHLPATGCLVLSSCFFVSESSGRVMERMILILIDVLGVWYAGEPTNPFHVPATIRTCTVFVCLAHSKPMMLNHWLRVVQHNLSQTLISRCCHHLVLTRSHGCQYAFDQTTRGPRNPRSDAVSCFPEQVRTDSTPADDPPADGDGWWRRGSWWFTEEITTVMVMIVPQRRCCDYDKNDECNYDRGRKW